MLENASSPSSPASANGSPGPNQSRLRRLLGIGMLLFASALVMLRYSAAHTPAHPPHNNFAPQTSPVSGNLASPPIVAAPQSQSASLPIFGTNALSSAAVPPTATNLEADVAHARTLLEREPHNIKARIDLAALLDIQKHPDQAEDLLEEPLRQGQRDSVIYHALGMLYLRNEQYIGAAEAFKIEVRLRPKDAVAHLKLGTAYAYLSAPDAADREYRTTLKLDPNLTDAYMGLGYVNDRTERYPYAVRYLQEYLRRSSEPGPGYALLCRVYLNMQAYARAVEAGKTAVKDLPDNPNIWYNLGQAQSNLPGSQAREEAAQALEHAVRLAPNWAEAHFDLGSAYVRLNRPDDAVAQYREAVRNGPTQGRYHYELGRLLVQQHHAEEGQKEIAMAQPLIALNLQEVKLKAKLVLAPRNIDILLKLGQINKQLGDYAQARMYFRDALMVTPNNAQARAELDGLRHPPAPPAH